MLWVSKLSFDLFQDNFNLFMIMKSKRSKVSPPVNYSDEPIMARIVESFLPSPDKLIFREKKTRGTLTLSEKSLDFCKSAAKKHGASYQAMIRRLIDYYVANQKSAS